ncbi:MAG: hypothetical protein O8C66_07315 [Candidatus Methanoperedens sp.]|nr:hypothetical protein [Candidatus Methanoperedens sp.]MCZ7370303.1 hypothetical protein [Candidatus Methanoperedens sp.]
MVTLDPCDRLKIIEKQLVPAIINSARFEIDTLDIKSAIEKNLPDLEKNCYSLADRCEKKWPECGTEIGLCDREKIKELFQEARDELKKIWEEKDKKKIEQEAETEEKVMEEIA